MADEPTLEQEIDQAVEESVTEDTVEETREGDVTPEETKETSGSADEENIIPEDTQEESEEDTQVGDESSDKKSEGTQEDSAEDTPVEITPGTLAVAVSSGLTLEQARSFRSEEALSEFNSRVQYERSQAVQQQQQQQVQQELQEEVDPFVDFPKLDPENYDEGVVDVVDRLTDIAHDQYKQIAEFRNQQEQQAAYSLEAGKAEVKNWFDDETNKLGDDFKDELGEGVYSSLAAGSQHAVTRDAIADHMSVMIAGYQHHGMQLPPRSEIFSAAAKVVLASKYEELANSKFTESLEKQTTQTIQRVNKSKAKRNLTSEEEDSALGALIDSTFN